MFRLITLAALIFTIGITGGPADARPQGDSVARYRLENASKVQAQQRSLSSARSLTIHFNPTTISRNVSVQSHKPAKGGRGTLKLILPDDRAGPLLRRAANSRKPLRGVKFTAFLANGTPVRIIMTHVIIVSYQTGSAATDRPICYLRYKLER